jgi:hypothetical protein
MGLESRSNSPDQAPIPVAAVALECLHLLNGWFVLLKYLNLRMYALSTLIPNPGVYMHAWHRYPPRLSRDAQPGDALFVHYSGHGGNVRDTNGDEADGYDETLVPLDYERAGQIIDDLILAELVLPLPEGTFHVEPPCMHAAM